MHTKTSDLGFAIRDAMEGTTISRIRFTADNEVKEYRCADEIVAMDISDVDNPIFEMASGARFRVHIIAI